jgi:hypothetical protein
VKSLNSPARIESHREPIYADPASMIVALDWNREWLQVTLARKFGFGEWRYCLPRRTRTKLAFFVAVPSHFLQYGRHSLQRVLCRVLIEATPKIPDEATSRSLKVAAARGAVIQL